MHIYSKKIYKYVYICVYKSRLKENSICLWFARDTQQNHPGIFFRVSWQDSKPGVRRTSRGKDLAYVLEKLWWF